MLFRLRHDAFIGGDHEERDVDSGRPGEHVADKPLVPGHIDDAGLDLIAQRERCKPEVDGYAATLLFLPAVAINPRQRFDEGRLPMIDVAGGADYEAAGVG